MLHTLELLGIIALSVVLFWWIVCGAVMLYVFLTRKF